MRKIYKLLFLNVFVLVFSIVSIVAQSIPTPKPSLTNTVSNYTHIVENEDGKQAKLTLAGVAELNRLNVRINNYGAEATGEGYPLIEILKPAGIGFGETLPGERPEIFLLSEAVDKYRAVFALPELDPIFTDKIILLADRRDGQPLSKERRFAHRHSGQEKQGRWARKLARLKILCAGGSNK